MADTILWLTVLKSRISVQLWPSKDCFFVTGVLGLFIYTLRNGTYLIRVQMEKAGWIMRRNNIFRIYPSCFFPFYTVAPFSA